MVDLDIDDEIWNFLHSVVDGVVLQLLCPPGPRPRSSPADAASRSSDGNESSTGDDENESPADGAIRGHLNFNNDYIERNYHSRRENRRSHPYNRRGSPYGRRRGSRTDVKIKENCKSIIELSRHFALNITSIKDIVSQQTELMKLASEYQARPAS